MDEEIKITVYAHTDKGTMYDTGTLKGLDDTAAHFLSHYSEVALELTVIKETGEVVHALAINP